MGTLLNSFRQDPIDNMVAEIAANTAVYYVFASTPSPWPDESNPPGVLLSYQESVFNPLSRMLFGKRIFADNIKYLIPRYTWSTNTVFAQYDHTDINLFNEQFYCVNSRNEVYKCLYNSFGSPSTIEPSIVQNTSFITSDGYVWKYMFSIDEVSMDNFGNFNYIPVVPNTAVQGSAHSGIEVIEVVAGGNGYITSYSGRVEYVNPVNSAIVMIDSGANPNDDFYNKSAFYVTSGASQGVIANITGYVVNTSGNWLLLGQQIPGLVAGLTTYEINPSVVLRGDGEGAMAISETSNGVISKIYVISSGNNYTRCSATIQANSSFGAGANLSPYVPPIGGHGANPTQELGCKTLGIYCVFDGGEANTIHTECSFRTAGLLRNAMAANGSAHLTSNTFNQILSCNIEPAILFSPNNYVVGSKSGAQGNVIFCNTTVLLLDGDKNFGTGNNAQELLTEYFQNGTPTGLESSLNVVFSWGDMLPDSPDILWLDNFMPVQRSNTNFETIKLTVSL